LVREQALAWEGMRWWIEGIKNEGDKP